MPNRGIVVIMGFQDEAAKVLTSVAEQIGNAPDSETAGVDKVMTLLLKQEGADDARIQSVMHAHGDKLAEIGRQTLVDLGFSELVSDGNAVIFAAMAALASVQTDYRTEIVA